MIYIRGDTHGQFDDVADFCRLNHTTKKDIMIILGDVGLNYYGDSKDLFKKEFCQHLPITLFCIHGNHENRPQHLDSYYYSEFRGGPVLVEKDYPDLIFAVDGGVYDFNGHRCLAIGGAYSVDKFYRLQRGWHWWPDEQPDARTKEYVENVLAMHGHQMDVILSHTCPLHYIPVETFLPQIDQSTVDNSTELWLGEIERSTDYNKWYCGHYHINKAINKIRFLFEKTEPFLPKIRQKRGEKA